MANDTTYYDCRSRYENDPLFRNLVDLLLAHAMQHKYTPGELRDAAFMAAMRFEELHIRPMRILRDDPFHPDNQEKQP